jgi:SLA1 homology domain 1, SHD1/WD40-like Beta Propeller Repeat
MLLALGAERAWAQAPEQRTWTAGDHKVQAKFVSVADGMVTLEQADGEILEVELKQLSAADRKYVADQQQKAASNPFRKKAANPFQKKARNAAGGGRAMSPSEEGGSAAGVKPDWSSVRELTTTSAGAGWNVPVTSATHQAAAERLRAVSIPRTTGFFQSPKGLVLSARGSRAVVAYAGAQPGPNQTGTTRITVFDLEKGNLLSTAEQSGLFAPLALRDDGMQVLMRTDAFGPGRHDTLEFWNLNKSGIGKGDQWVPYENADGSGGGDRDVRWATYLAPDRLATASESGSLVIWQVKPLKPLATLSMQSGCTPALSPDGKFLAFATSKDIGVLDVANLDVVAVQAAPFPNMAWTSFSFSPTGKRLACKVFVNKVFVYDIANGALYREISLQGLNVQQPPAVFSDDDHLILGDHTLIDLESQVRLWQYLGNEHAQASNGICWFEVAARQNQAGALVPGKIPTAEVRQSLKTAMRDPSFFIVKRGSSASIDASGIPDASRRNEVIESLTTNLGKIGVTVAPGSAVTFQASLEQGKEQEIGYRRFGGGFRVERFKVHPWLARIRVVYNGQTAWDWSGSSVPFFDMAQLKEGETLQDHVRKLEQPNYSYFANAELPKLLTRPMGQAAGTLGVSTVTLSGIR